MMKWEEKPCSRKKPLLVWKSRYDDVVAENRRLREALWKIVEIAQPFSGDITLVRPIALEALGGEDE